MTRKHNPLIELLEADKPIFSIWANYYGVGSDYQSAAWLQGNPHYDFVLYDLEHQPFDVEGLRRFLWDLLDPRVIQTHGRSAIKPVIVRLPANGRERNDWVIKQALDQGVAGLMFPHIETPEEALGAVAASRYAQAPDAPDFLPEGRRGYSPAVPARYWGLDPEEYQAKSDIWGLDPDGNLLLVFIIESARGVENVREIARALHDAGVKAILWAGGGDLSISYGERPYGAPAPLADAGLERILAAGREFGLPVGMNSFSDVEGDYARGARAFFTVGPVVMMNAPMTADVRQAVGR